MSNIEAGIQMAAVGAACAAELWLISHSNTGTTDYLACAFHQFPPTFISVPQVKVLVKFFHIEIQMAAICEAQVPLSKAMARLNQHQMRFHAPKFGGDRTTFPKRLVWVILVHLFQTDFPMTGTGQQQVPLSNAMARFNQYRMRFHPSRFG